MVRFLRSILEEPYCPAVNGKHACVLNVTNVLRFKFRSFTFPIDLSGTTWLCMYHICKYNQWDTRFFHCLMSSSHGRLDTSCPSQRDDEEFVFDVGSLNTKRVVARFSACCEAK